MRLIALSFMLAGSAHAAITGNVYQDYNADGIFTTAATNALPQIDQRVAGVTISAFNTAGACGTPTISTAAGSYSLSTTTGTACGAGTLRIEFTTIPTGFVEAGGSGATAVQFVADGGTANLALSKAAEYCQSNPLLVTPQYAFRTPTGAADSGPPAGTSPIIRSTAYLNLSEFDGDITANWTADTTAGPGGFSNSPPNGVRPAPANQAVQSQVGSVWGLAYEPTTNRLFSATFLKRRTPFGPNGPGAIYVTTPETTGTPSTDGALYVDLNAVFSTAPTPGGADPHSGTWTTDLTAIPQVGKRGLGDIDINSTGTTLYTIGLNDKQLYRIPTSGTLNSTTITRVAIPAPTSATPITGLTNCASAADVRPFAVGVDSQDRVYVGSTCTEESTGNPANVRYYIFRLNAAGTGFDAVSEGRFRSTILTANAWFSPSGTAANQTAGVQSWLTDISFDRGDMVLGIRDRFGDQTHDGLTPYENPFARGFGDIVKNCANTAGSGATSFVQESNGVCGGVTAAASVEPTGSTNNDGPSPSGTSAPPATNREWYSGDNAADNAVAPNSTPIRNNREGGLGGTLAIPGFRDVIETAYDPVDRDNTQNLVNANFNTGGFKRFNRSTGLLEGNYDVFEQAETNNFAKGNGLGDVEALCDPQPIRVGNRIFLDANNNGIQDPTETGISGITVNLYNAGGTIVGTTTTDANGNYQFELQRAAADEAAGSRNDASVILANANLYGQSFTVGIPGTTTNGTGAGGTNNIATNLVVSAANQGTPGGQQDARDSEGVLLAIPATTTMVAASITIPTTPGQNSFTVDFGFAPGLDFGDLPDTGAGTGAGNYETLLANGGPRNTISDVIRLGAAAGSSSSGYDAEIDGQQGTGANGDNGNRDNDENGLAITSLKATNTAIVVPVSVFNNSTAAVNLCAYFDFNGDGVFTGTGETLTSSVGINATQQTVNLNVVPGANASANTIYGRFRLQTAACSPNGDGGNGEVEDYAFTTTRSGDLTVTNSAAGLYCPGQSVTYTIVYSNPNTGDSQATSVPITADLIGTDEGTLAGVPLFATANWAVTATTGSASAALTTGTNDINTTLTLPPASSITFTVQGVFANAATGTRTAGDDLAAPAGYTDTAGANSASTVFTVNPTCSGTPSGAGALCANVASAPPATLVCSAASEQTVNGYWAGAANAAIGSRCVAVGSIAAAQGTGTIAAGDTLIVMQMQDADITSANSSSYGDGTAGAPGGASAAQAGKYEYVIAQRAVATNPTLGSCAGLIGTFVEVAGGNAQGPGPATGGLINSYSASAPDTFQVVRVAVTGDVSFTNAGCSYGAPAWNGTTGGVVAIDSTGSINLGGAAATTRFNASGDGFRGGACAALTTASTTQQFATATTGTTNTKGESAAGVASALPGGALGLGAPASGGGSGQLCNATNGFSAAGGGANGGSGGLGGGGLAVGCTGAIGGHGGGVIPGLTDTRLTLGGGGGGGAISAAAVCNGGAGGGVVILRANALTGQGTILANAEATPGNLATTRAGGGGGAGGTVIIQTSISGGTTFANTTINANGGDAISNTGVNAGGAGGGGGGRILISQTASAPVGTRTAGFGAGGNTAATDGGAGTAGTITTGIDPVTTSPGVKPAYICAQSATVPVTLSRVQVSESGSDLVVNFHTATEAGTLGYRVLADLGRGVQARVEVGSVPSKSIDSLKEQAYSVRARNPGADQVWIEEFSVDGKSELYGPYAVGQTIGETNLAPAMNWSAINAEQATFREAQSLALRRWNSGVAELSVSTSTWINLTAAQLAAAGVDTSGVDFSVQRGSAQVPVNVQLNGTALQSLSFYADSVTDSLYTKTAVYRISRGAGAVLATSNGASTSPGSASVLSERTFNENVLYSFSSPLSDPWFSFRGLRSGASTGGDYVFSVNDRVASTNEAIRLSYWGGLNYSGDGADHHVIFKLNGVAIGEDRFDGFAARNLSLNLPANLLQNGANTLRVELPNDTGFAADIVNVDAFTLVYTRQLAVQNNRLNARINALSSDNLFSDGFGDVIAASVSSYTISNLTAPAVVLHESQGVRTLIASTDGSASVNLRVNARVGDRLIVEPKAFATGPLTAAPMSSDPITAASYLILSHPSFIDGLAPFVSAKQAQGFTVNVVDVEAVYRYYNAGQVDPAAISAAIRKAASLGTTHVLLVGGDTYDYHNVLGVNSVSFIPTNYRRTSPIIAFAPADSAFADTDNDGMPNLAIGRWPVRSSAELSALIAKTLTYRNANKALFVTDRSLNGVSFRDQATPLVAMLNPSWTSNALSLDSFASGDAASARAAVVSQLQTGTTLLSYFGHSAPASWSREGLITANQVTAGLFDPVDQAFTVLQLGCWGTYFVEPTATTVAHQLLLQPKGAAAVIGSASLTESASDLAFANVLLPKLGTLNLGPAVMQTQQALGVQLPEAKDVILGSTLLGDPALQ